jgi:hypothetical protein
MTELDHSDMYDKEGRPKYFYRPELVAQIKHWIPNEPLLHRALDKRKLSALAFFKGYMWAHQQELDAQPSRKEVLDRLGHDLEVEASCIAISLADRLCQEQRTATFLAGNVDE